MHIVWADDRAILFNYTSAVTAMLGYLEQLSTKPVDDFSSQEGGTAKSISVVPNDFRLLSRLLTENETSFDHLRSETSSSVPPLAPASLDSSAVAELDQLPVRETEAVKGNKVTSGSTETASLCSRKDDVTDENGRNNDDVVRACVAENDDAGVCEVQVMKGALGLGFCVEGGRASLHGDRPITVKRLFRGIRHVLLVYFTSHQVATVGLPVSLSTQEIRSVEHGIFPIAEFTSPDFL